VIRQISSDIPQVTFLVSYTAKDVHRPTTLMEGTTVSLYGEYGYQMAQLSPAENWLTILTKGACHDGSSNLIFAASSLLGPNPAV
jgi:hypothetical protein